jgi:NSS family neurotransmitter:Na+ symporter
LAREQWRSRTGFILAALGSAVGVGNIWRFAYVAGENGGGAFLLVYFAFVLIVGIPLVIAELALGRRAQGDATAAFEPGDGGGAGWRLVGFLATGASVLILSYYAVIAGWVAKYLAGSLTGTLWTAAAEGHGRYFARLIANPAEPVAWHLAVISLGMVVVVAGVQRGIERLNRLIMPLLALLVLSMALFSMFLPGAGAGLRFLFAPDWSALLSPGVYLAALGQAFFSLGIGMGIYITYGSYLASTHGLPRSAAVIAIGDTLIAVLAGLAIFPAVFSFGFDPAAGPHLVFVTLPQIFLAMPAGKVIAPIFFALLLGAALTSAVSLLEVGVACAAHRLGMRRWTATAAAGGLAALLGIPSALGYGVLDCLRPGGRHVLDMVDFAVSDIVLPVSAILTALYVGWRWSRLEQAVQGIFRSERLGQVWLWVMRIVAPGLMALVLVHGIAAA